MIILCYSVALGRACAYRLEAQGGAQDLIWSVIETITKNDKSATHGELTGETTTTTFIK